MLWPCVNSHKRFVGKIMNRGIVFWTYLHSLSHQFILTKGTTSRERDFISLFSILTLSDLSREPYILSWTLSLDNLLEISKPTAFVFLCCFGLCSQTESLIKLVTFGWNWPISWLKNNDLWPEQIFFLIPEDFCSSPESFLPVILLRCSVLFINKGFKQQIPYCKRVFYGLLWKYTAKYYIFMCYDTWGLMYM